MYKYQLEILINNQWIIDIRYYTGIIPTNDWRLCDIPNKRRNAILLTN